MCSSTNYKETSWRWHETNHAKQKKNATQTTTPKTGSTLSWSQDVDYGPHVRLPAPVCAARVSSSFLRTSTIACITSEHPAIPAQPNAHAAPTSTLIPSHCCLGTVFLGIHFVVARHARHARHAPQRHEFAKQRTHSQQRQRRRRRRRDDEKRDVTVSQPPASSLQNATQASSTTTATLVQWLVDVRQCDTPNARCDSRWQCECVGCVITCVCTTVNVHKKVVVW